MKRHETLMELHAITEEQSGCIKATRFMRLVWVPASFTVVEQWAHARDLGGGLLCSVSHQRSVEVNHRLNRMVDI